jgi:hypothetical protein
MNFPVLSRLLTAGALMCGLSAQAETYVYVTNSTDQPITVSTVQTGDKPLIRNTHWGTYDVVVAPYATQRVLWMNRDTGITSGKTFYFDTTVTGAQGGPQVLRQKLLGKSVGSTLWQGAKAAAFTTPWYTDRHVHTHAVATNEQLSFTAEFTGGFDDVYYVVHDANVKEPAVDDANTLKVLAYNTYGVFVAPQICERYAAMPEAVSQGYDVIVFSEVFGATCRDQLMAALRSQYPFQSALVDRAGNVLSGGVKIISRYPIATQDIYIYPDCSSDNCFSNKGFAYVEIIKQGRSFHVLGTHTNAYNGTTDRAVRLVQLGQMGSYLNGRNISAGDAVVYAGDLNVDKYATPTDYQQMLGLLNTAAPNYIGQPFTFDPTINVNGSGTQEYLDYVLPDLRYRAPVESVNTVRVFRSLNTDIWKRRDLSDHFAVSGVMRY